MGVDFWGEIFVEEVCVLVKEYGVEIIEYM